jgi:GT2 family glycosyltransferase
MEKKVCVVINNWNGGNLLLKCISSILNVTEYLNYKVIVVDDGSTDGSGEEVKRKFKNVKVIFLKEHKGASFTRNVGIEYCLKNEKADYVIFLDNDVKIEDKNWIEKLISIMEKEKEIGILAPIIYTPEYYQTFTKKTIEYTKYVPSACIIVRKDVFKKIGGFDINFLFVGNEDPDFCNRVRASNFKIAVTNKTKVFHNTSTKKRKSIFWSFVSTYNYVRYILLNLRENSVFEIFSLIVIRKNFSRGYNPSNLIIVSDWWKRLILFPLAFLLNLIRIREILKLRRERNQFHFLSEKIKKL